MDRVVILAVIDLEHLSPFEKLDQFIICKRLESELNDAVMILGPVDESAEPVFDMRVKPCVTDLRLILIEPVQVKGLDILFLPAVNSDQVIHYVEFIVLVIAQHDCGVVNAVRLPEHVEGFRT